MNQKDQAFLVAGLALFGLVVASAGASSTGALPMSKPITPRIINDTGLDRDFALKLQDVVNGAAAKGVELRLLEGERSPQRQASIYSEGRTDADMQAAAARLKGYGAPWLASLMAGTSGQPSKTIRTKALPGEGFHSFGLAADFGWYVGGKYEPSLYRGGSLNGYAVMGELAEARGLGWGIRIKGLTDAGHLQSAPIGQTPVTAFGGWAAVDQRLHSKFGSIA